MEYNNWSHSDSASRKSGSAARTPSPQAMRPPSFSPTPPPTPPGTGETARPESPSGGGQPSVERVVIPPVMANPNFMSGLLTRYIGKMMRIESSLGTGGALTDRVGRLVEVGADYVMITPVPTNQLLILDIYSIKAITIFIDLPPNGYTNF